MRKGSDMKRKSFVICITLAVMLCMCACSSKEQLSTSRAYRDAVPSDYVPMIDDGEFFTDGYVIPEEDRMSMLESYEIINTIRQDEGLEPLKWDADLEFGALKRAEELTVKFDHVRPSGQSWFTVAPEKVLGENIYIGSGHADVAMDSWMKNQPDRENFLCPEFTRVAVAVYRDAEDHFYWACEFANESPKEK